MEYVRKSFSIRVAQLFTVVCICLGTNTLLADFPAEPKVVIDSSGDAVGIWEVTGGSTDYIQAAIFDGTSWGTPTTISGSEDAFFAQLTANPNSQTIAGWLFLDTINEVYTLVTSRLTSGTWESPVVMSSTSESVNDFRFEINSSGQTMLIWESLNTGSGDTEIWASTASFAGSWSTPAQLF